MTTLVKDSFITKNWFYVIDEDSPDTITIKESVSAIFYMTDTTKSFTINLLENSRLDFFGFYKELSPLNLLFKQDKPNSKLEIKSMFYNYKNDLKSVIKSVVWADNSSSNMKINSIITSWNLNLDTSIAIEENTKKAKAHLSQNNIFTWEEWSVRWVPTLEVKSDDIEASHAMQTQRIPENDLFYFTSRWIPLNKAKYMLVESYFTKTFSCINMVDHYKFESIKEDFLKVLDINQA